MTELNYDLIPEELKKRAIEFLVVMHDQDAVDGRFVGFFSLIKEILASQQTKKPVDMSVLVDSGVLCEFSHNAPFVNSSKGFLISIKNEKYNPVEWEYCRPLYGHWHSARNFDDVAGLLQSLSEAGFDVEIELERELNTYIEHFRIIGLQPNYCMPWEV